MANSRVAADTWCTVSNCTARNSKFDSAIITNVWKRASVARVGSSSGITSATSGASAARVGSASGITSGGTFYTTANSRASESECAIFTTACTTARQTGTWKTVQEDKLQLLSSNNCVSFIAATSTSVEPRCTSTYSRRISRVAVTTKINTRYKETRMVWTSRIGYCRIQRFAAVSS